MISEQRKTEEILDDSLHLVLMQIDYFDISLDRLFGKVQEEVLVTPRCA